MVKLDPGALKITLVIISDTVLSADKLGVPGAVVAVLEVVRGTLALVEEGLSLAPKDALILEGFRLSGADWLGNGGATAWAEAGSLGDDTDIGAGGDALVLIGHVVSAANWLEVILAGTLDDDGGNNVVGRTTWSRANPLDI